MDEVCGKNASNDQKLKILVESLESTASLSEIKKLAIITEIRWLLSEEDANFENQIEKSRLLEIIDFGYSMCQKVDSPIERAITLELAWILINIGFCSEHIILLLFQKQPNLVGGIKQLLSTPDLQMIDLIFQFLRNCAITSLDYIKLFEQELNLTSVIKRIAADFPQIFV